MALMGQMPQNNAANPVAGIFAFAGFVVFYSSIGWGLVVLLLKRVKFRHPFRTAGLLFALDVCVVAIAVVFGLVSSKIILVFMFAPAVLWPLGHLIIYATCGGSPPRVR